MRERPDPNPAAGRPNVLVIIADQLRPDHLGFGGHPLVSTPHLDALAAEGVAFGNVHVTNPTCMPSRASLMTGRWPQQHGTRCNGLPLDPDVSTLPGDLASCGYRTSAVGKLHHQNMGWDFEPEQREQIMLSEPQLLEDCLPDARRPVRDAGWDRWEDSLLHSEQPVTMPGDYYGYQEVDLVVGHGDRPSGHYVHWARERGFNPLTDAGPQRALDDHGGHWAQVYTSAVPAGLHPSAYVAERTCARLEDHAADGEPFFLFASFPDPHHPFAPPAGYDRLYDPADVPVPDTFHQDHSNSPEHVRRMAERRGMPGEDPTMTWIATEEQYRVACAAELGLITLLDDQVGRILQTLERTGLAENTVVVFTSDHGDMFGDHGMMLKHFTHYRGVTNVPLVMRVPAGLPGAGVGISPAARTAASTALVSNADLVPTLLELTGVPGHRGIQGRSLVPLLRGEASVHRRALIVEEDQPFGLDGLPAPVHIRSVITPEARYTRYFGTDAEELYLLDSDPEEAHNLAARPGCEEVVERMRQLMLDELLALTDHGVRVRAAA
jgi:arylsulfatase A-like enzyme